MTEEKHEVKVFVIDKRCDQCQNGYLQYTSMNKCKDGYVFVHHCDFCNDRKVFKEKFPLIRYEQI